MVAAGEPGTGGAAGFGNAAVVAGQLLPATFLEGQFIMLDPAGALCTAIGAGNLRAFTESQENGGQLGTAN